MVKAFDDAVFAMKPGDIVGPVQSEFGFHVIKLAGITPARTLSFDEAKGPLEADLKRQKVAQKFAAAADQFQNLVYEQADSLAGVAKALDLEAKTSQWATRADAQRLAFGNAKFVQALFAPESVSAKRNTEAIEVGPNTLMAGRVVEYKPAAPRPFDDVKDEIRRQLVAREASEMAQKLGREKLALLEQGKSDKEAGVTFGKPVSVLRNQMQPGFSPEALTGVFRADAAKLPQYVGATNERGGYSIYRVQKTMLPPTATDPSKLVAGPRSDRRAAEPRALRRVHHGAEGEGGPADQPGQPGKEVAARAARRGPGRESAAGERAIASRRMRPTPRCNDSYDWIGGRGTVRNHEKRRPAAAAFVWREDPQPAQRSRICDSSRSRTRRRAVSSISTCSPLSLIRPMGSSDS